MRPYLALALLALLAGKQASPAEVIPVFGTGLDNSGAVLPDGAIDSHYTLSLYPGQVGSTPASVYVLGGITFGYNLSGTASKWVSWSPTWINATPSGNWRYQTTFDLTGFLSNTAVLTGRILSDNDGAIFLNGVPTGILNDDVANWTNFNITTGFVPGINTLEVHVLNDSFVSFNPSAMRMDLSGVATAVPEPSTILLASMAACGLLLKHRRVAWLSPWVTKLSASH